MDVFFKSQLELDVFFKFTMNTKIVSLLALAAQISVASGKTISFNLFFKMLRLTELDSRFLHGRGIIEEGTKFLVKKVRSVQKHFVYLAKGTQWIL